MARGRTPYEPVTHPDPGWWKRCAPVNTGNALDLCYYCGHIRSLHIIGGCTAHSASLMGSPDPCDCTNTPTGSIYRNPTTLGVTP